MQSIRLVIAEGRTLYRQGLATLLGAEPGFEVVGEAGSVEEARRICARTEPDLILLGAALPDPAGDGDLAVIPCLRVCCPHARIVVIGEAGEPSVHGADAVERAERGRALQTGAAAYLRPTVDRQELIRTLWHVTAHREEPGTEDAGAAGESCGTETHTSQPGHGKHGITERERAVVILIAQGHCNKEIAQRLGISTQTVKNHVSHLLEKLALADRTQLAVYTVEHHFDV